MVSLTKKKRKGVFVLVNSQLVKGIFPDWIGEVVRIGGGPRYLQLPVEQVTALEKMAVDSRAGVYDGASTGEVHKGGRRRNGFGVPS